MDSGRQTYSRYQILCAEREAWNGADESADDGDTYRYDGISFWRRDARGKERLLPSWRTPVRGWYHKGACDCDLCAAHRPAAVRPLSVA